MARGEPIEVVGDEPRNAIDEEFERELRAMGFEPGPEPVPEAHQEWPFVLLEENVRPFDLFVGLLTQWNRCVTPLGALRWLGLDYAAVEASMRLERIPRADRAALFADLRRMEAAALPVLNADR